MKNSDLYVILTNRKRTAVALAHSVVFLLIALRGLLIGKSVAPIWLQQADRQSSFGILLVYLVVSTVLMQLARMSGTARERMYFVFCGSSATVGTLRNIVGDPIQHLGLLLRVVMLLCAVATGVIILRIHSSRVPPENQCDTY